MGANQPDIPAANPIPNSIMPKVTIASSPQRVPPITKTATPEERTIPRISMMLLEATTTPHEDESEHGPLPEAQRFMKITASTEPTAPSAAVNGLTIARGPNSNTLSSE